MIFISLFLSATRGSFHVVILNLYMVETDGLSVQSDNHIIGHLRDIDG